MLVDVLIEVLVHVNIKVIMWSQIMTNDMWHAMCRYCEYWLMATNVMLSICHHVTPVTGCQLSCWKHMMVIAVLYVCFLSHCYIS